MLDAKAMQDTIGIPNYQDGMFTPGTMMLQTALFIRSLGVKLLSNRLRI